MSTSASPPVDSEEGGASGMSMGACTAGCESGSGEDRGSRPSPSIVVYGHRTGARPPWRSRGAVALRAAASLLTRARLSAWPYSYRSEKCAQRRWRSRSKRMPCAFRVGPPGHPGGPLSACPRGRGAPSPPRGAALASLRLSVEPAGSREHHMPALPEKGDGRGWNIPSSDRVHGLARRNP